MVGTTPRTPRSLYRSRLTNYPRVSLLFFFLPSRHEPRSASQRCYFDIKSDQLSLLSGAEKRGGDVMDGCNTVFVPHATMKHTPRQTHLYFHARRDLAAGPRAKPIASGKTNTAPRRGKRLIPHKFIVGMPGISIHDVCRTPGKRVARYRRTTIERRSTTWKVVYELLLARYPADCSLAREKASKRDSLRFARRQNWRIPSLRDISIAARFSLQRVSERYGATR